MITSATTRRLAALTVALSLGSISSAYAQADAGGTITAERDPIREDFGARVAPYEGFLALPKESFPSGYVEKSHHFTKREYLLTLTKTVKGESFSLEIVESDRAQFLEPKNEYLVKEFMHYGRAGRVYAYREHLSEQPAITLYWMNAPKQRLLISIEQVPSEEWSADDLIRLLQADDARQWQARIYQHEGIANAMCGRYGNLIALEAHKGLIIKREERNPNIEIIPLPLLQPSGREVAAKRGCVRNVPGLLELASVLGEIWTDFLGALQGARYLSRG